MKMLTDGAQMLYAVLARQRVIFGRQRHGRHARRQQLIRRGINAGKMRIERRNKLIEHLLHVSTRAQDRFRPPSQRTRSPAVQPPRSRPRNLARAQVVDVDL